MCLKFFAPTLLLACAFGSCRPKPIDISVPQQSGTMVISSLCADNGSVSVSASYSVSGVQNLIDTTGGGQRVQIPAAMLVDSAIVTIAGPDGKIYALDMVRPGLFNTNRMEMKNGAAYSLTVRDLRRNLQATGHTVYIPKPTIQELKPVVHILGKDTTVKVAVTFSDTPPSAYYVVSYNTMRFARENRTPFSIGLGALYAFRPRTIDLFQVSQEEVGQYNREISLVQVKPNDTVIISVYQVDRPYFDYLLAYKRTGALINQMTGEPINLPSNVSTGLGYFSLHQPIMNIFDLNQL